MWAADPTMGMVDSSIAALADLVAGGPAKRARAARDQRAAAIATLEAARIEAALIAAQGGRQGGAVSAAQIAAIEAQKQSDMLRTLGLYGMIGVGAFVLYMGFRK